MGNLSVRGTPTFVLALLLVSVALAHAQEDSLSAKESNLIKLMAQECALDMTKLHAGTEAKESQFKLSESRHKGELFALSTELTRSYGSCARPSVASPITDLATAAQVKVKHATPIRAAPSILESSQNCFAELEDVCQARNPDPAALGALNICNDEKNNSIPTYDDKTQKVNICAYTSYQKNYSYCLEKITKIQIDVHKLFIPSATRKLGQQQDQLINGQQCINRKALNATTSFQGIYRDRHDELKDPIKPNVLMAVQETTEKASEVDGKIAQTPAELEQQTLATQKNQIIEIKEVLLRESDALTEQGNLFTQLARSEERNVESLQSAQDAYVDPHLESGTNGNESDDRKGIAWGSLGIGAAAGAAAVLIFKSDDDKNHGVAKTANAPVASGQNSGASIGTGFSYDDPDGASFDSGGKSSNSTNSVGVRSGATPSSGASMATGGDHYGSDKLGATTKAGDLGQDKQGAKSTELGAGALASVSEAGQAAPKSKASLTNNSGIGYEEAGKGGKRSSVNLSSSSADESIEGLIKGMFIPTDNTQTGGAGGSTNVRRGVASTGQASSDEEDTSVSLWQRVRNKMSTQVELGKVVGPKSDI